MIMTVKKSILIFHILFNGPLFPLHLTIIARIYKGRTDSASGPFKKENAQVHLRNR